MGTFLNSFDMTKQPVLQAVKELNKVEHFQNAASPSCVLIISRSLVLVQPPPPKLGGPARTHGLHNVPATWVTLLDRTDFRAVRALESPDRSTPDHNP